MAFNVLVIGEAASKVSLELRAEHPEIPWLDIINMRHRIVHGYAFIDIYGSNGTPALTNAESVPNWDRLTHWLHHLPGIGGFLGTAFGGINLLTVIVLVLLPVSSIVLFRTPS